MLPGPSCAACLGSVTHRSRCIIQLLLLLWMWHDARLNVALAPDSLTGQEACLGSFTPISDGSMLSYGFAAVARIALYK